MPRRSLALVVLGLAACTADAARDPLAPPAPSRSADALPARPQLLVSRQSGKCVDVLGADRSAGAPVTIWPCHGAENQRWTLPPEGGAGEVRVYGDMCLDAYGGAGNDFDAIVVWPCHGGANQQWALTEAGELKGANGKCVDVLGARTEDLTPLVLYSCHGGINQRYDARAPSDCPGCWDY